MTDLTFWLHMNDEYMWRWFCSDSQGTLIAISAQSFFHRADAVAALEMAQRYIGSSTLLAA